MGGRCTCVRQAVVMAAQPPMIGLVSPNAPTSAKKYRTSFRPALLEPRTLRNPDRRASQSGAAK